MKNVTTYSCRSNSKVETEIHHIIPEAVLQRLKQFPNSQFEGISPGSLPGHAWRGAAHQAYHNAAVTGMNPALLNESALQALSTPQDVADALFRYYFNNDQKPMAAIVGAWFKVRGITVVP